MSFRRLLPLIALAVGGPAGPAAAQYRSAPHDIPTGSNIDPNVRLDEKIDAQIPLDQRFRNSAGEWVTLADCVAGKPTILVLGYNRCPMICNATLQGVIEALREFPADFTAGKQFSMIFLSIDAKEQPGQAKDKRDWFLKEYREGQLREDAEKGVHFLVGPQPSIDAVTDAVGFRFKFDKQYKEYNHPSGLVVLTPAGKVARYFNGILFNDEKKLANGGTTTLRQSLIDAGAGVTGGLAPEENRLMSCFRLDWLEKKFGKNVLLAVRIAGALSVVALALGIVYLVRRKPAAAVPTTANATTDADRPSGVTT